MKHQLSKVALIATLAFTGIGFAGTQQAKAGDCPPVHCGEPAPFTVQNGTSGCYPGTPYIKTYCATCENCTQTRLQLKVVPVTCDTLVLRETLSGLIYTQRFGTYDIGSADTSQNKTLPLPCQNADF